MAETEDKERIYLWIDLETNGTDLFARGGFNSSILEVGWFITNQKLVIVHEGGSKVIRQDDDYDWIVDMDDVVREMHTKSGLIDEVRKATMPLNDVERLIIAHLRSVDPHMAKDWVVAGSGVAAFDIQFLKRDMPDLMALMHYSTLDVGQVRRFLKLTGIKIDADLNLLSTGANKAHRAYDDAIAHLNETRAIIQALTRAVYRVVTWEASRNYSWNTLSANALRKDVTNISEDTNDGA